MASWSDYLTERNSLSTQELCEFLRIPSISALPAHAGDVVRAAQWVASRLSTAGAEHVQVTPTEGHPIVTGDWLHAPGRPTILVYGHFDVQPVDPEELWTTPPFAAEVRSGRVYARGASDMKGNLLATILATEALLRTSGALPVNVKFIYEGEEEVGSGQLRPFVAGHKEMLRCDMVINADGGQWSETEPSLLLGLRGACVMQVDVEGARSDLHSGLAGGGIQNPLRALAELLTSMHAPDSSVAVAGFYDDVVPLGPGDRARLAAVPFDEAGWLEQMGARALFGEAGYSTYERTWARPTLEIVGMWGGFQGPGFKTVLPREAHAKINCRLVPNQDPNRILELLDGHVAAHCPPGIAATTHSLGGLAQPYLIAADHPGMAAARVVLRGLYGREPYYVRSGGSVPACEVFSTNLGAPSVALGFGLPDENVHAPNEFMRVASFERAQSAYCLLMEQLAQPVL